MSGRQICRLEAVGIAAGAAKRDFEEGAMTSRVALR
jgi:hypothetical protein